ncbi:hypothetical protein BLA15816_07895 [Burkholderia lata]|nr:hypothetical protein BLA15816_07895 [Burkholderia lata]
MVFSRLSANFACGLCTEKIDATRRAAQGASQFLPLAPPTEDQCCASGSQSEVQERLPADQLDCRHSLHAWAAPEAIWRTSRTNVKMRGITKLTATGFERRSRTFSPSDTSESRKGSPTRQGHRYRHAVWAVASTWIPDGQSRGMKSLWFANVVRCAPEQSWTAHKRCRDITTVCAWLTTSVWRHRCGTVGVVVKRFQPMSSPDATRPRLSSYGPQDYAATSFSGPGHAGHHSPAIGCCIERCARGRCNCARRDRHETESWSFMGGTVA